MPASLENSAMATGLEKVSFHSNPKERECQRMLKLPVRRAIIKSSTNDKCWKVYEEKERYTYLNAEFQEQEGEIRKPSSVINAKKWRKPIE